MPVLFEPFRIGSLVIQNRFVRSATTSYWSDKRGIVRPEIIELYRNLAKGGVGLIVKGHLYVAETGKAHTGMAGISNEHHISKLRELTDAVHEHDGKIVAQLNHAGIYSMVDRAGPSPYESTSWKARALTSQEIEIIIESFGDASERALSAGFDGIQIHGAHGYLASQFLSRLVNRRNDEWGGSLEKRMQLLIEILGRIRSRVGNGYPVLLKMNCDDFSEDGFTIDDSVKVAEAICRHGLDAIEISGGGVGKREDLRKRAKSKDPDLAEASFAGHAKRIRDAVKPTRIALVNTIRSLRCMNAILSKDIADVISMSRPFIREPDIVEHLKAGQPEAACITCNACSSKNVFGKMMLRCHQEKK